MKLRKLSELNELGLSRNRIAKRGGLSWPVVSIYLNHEPRAPKEPSLIHIIKALDGMGLNWRDIPLGELVE